MNPRVRWAVSCLFIVSAVTALVTRIVSIATLSVPCLWPELAYLVGNVLALVGWVLFVYGGGHDRVPTHAQLITPPYRIPARTRRGDGPRA
jgi:hypothetical protein